MKTKLFILILAGLLLFVAFGTGASIPLMVDVEVDETRVKEGDMVQVTWTVNGGTPPYDSWIYWDAIWTEDTLIGNYGNQYHSVFRVRPGMLPLLSFKIEAYDEHTQWDNPLVVHSSSLGIDIVNLDGWTSPDSTRIELDRRQLYTGETVTANVYRVYETSVAGYYGFDYQWGITDANGRTTYTDRKRVSYKQDYDTVLSFSPVHGVSGHLKVIADEPMFTDDDTTKTYYSETFTILKGARQGAPQIQTPVQPVAARTHTPASLNQRMATRSGPGTQYTEEGTYNQNTAITLFETVPTNTARWGMVEFYYKGQKLRAYTGMQRIDYSGTVAQGALEPFLTTILSQGTVVYYGPGYDYKQRKEVPAGTLIRVYGTENGFSLCDYESGGKWVRAYFPKIIE